MSVCGRLAVFSYINVFFSVLHKPLCNRPSIMYSSLTDTVPAIALVARFTPAGKVAIVGHTDAVLGVAVVRPGLAVIGDPRHTLSSTDRSCGGSGQTLGTGQAHWLTTGWLVAPLRTRHTASIFSRVLATGTLN